MGKQRLEAFSDGIIAIIITVMVLELPRPHGGDWSALRPVLPVLLTYILSFVFIAIYWNNHHHLLQAARYVNGKVLWANMHLLFWLSLTPFVTDWMGENHFAPLAVAAYGAVLLCAGIAYFIVVRALISLHGQDSTLATAVGSDVKGKVSLALYAAAIPLAFVRTWLAGTVYVVVAILWLIPDPRIETVLAGGTAKEG